MHDLALDCAAYRTYDFSRHARTMEQAMALSASRLRQDVYRILDEVIATGVPVEVLRKGRRVRIVPVDPPGRLDRLVPHPDAVVGDPEDLVHLGWSHEWSPDEP